LKIKYHLCAEKSREIDYAQVIVQRTGKRKKSSPYQGEAAAVGGAGGEGLNEGKNYTGAYKLNRRL